MNLLGLWRRGGSQIAPNEARLLDVISAVRCSGLWGQLLLLLSAVLLTGACNQPHEFAGTGLEPPRTATDIVGTNWTGEPFSLQDLRGKAVLLFFGYTDCPDVCPLTLASMKDIKQQLGNDSEQFAVVFVTVDSERDTVARLADYIPAFDPTFYGVRMEEARLAAVQESYGIYAEKVDHGTHSGTSEVQHSDYRLVIDPVGNWRAVYASDVETESIAADIKYLLTE